jgi:hypothetical protein
MFTANALSGSRAVPGTDSALPDWRELVRLPEGELAKLDVAVVNLACAVGLPGWEGIDAAGCLRCLDDWAVGVRESTRRSLESDFRRQPAKYHHSEVVYRMLSLVCDLQTYCGVRYNPAKIDARPDEPFGITERFIHGAIQGPGGTCASMPVVFTAVGRRLGYPMRLVHTKNHVFCRWEDPESWVRVNVEGTTNGGMTPHPDEYYRTGIFEHDTRKGRYYGYLQSLTPREELASFLGQRSSVAEDSGEFMMGVEALVAAYEIDPHPCPRNLAWLRMLIQRWGERLKGQGQIGEGFNYPPAPVGSRRWPAIPWPWEAEIIALEAAQSGRKPCWFKAEWDESHRPLEFRR